MIVCLLGFRNVTEKVKIKKLTDWKYKGVSVNIGRGQDYDGAEFTQVFNSAYQTQSLMLHM